MNTPSCNNLISNLINTLGVTCKLAYLHTIVRVDSHEGMKYLKEHGTLIIYHIVSFMTPCNSAQCNSWQFTFYTSKTRSYKIHTHSHKNEYY